MSTLRAIDEFSRRGHALEDAFFRARDAELAVNLRKELAAFEEEQKLANISGIVDERVLLDLVRAGVRAESLLAVRMVPMVAVAWADRFMAPEERRAIVRAAVEDHIEPGSAASKLLDTWLEDPPDSRLIEAWKEYVTQMVRVMPPDSLKELQERTLRLCERVAKAAGGILGLGSISSQERTLIDEFKAAWTLRA